MKLFLSHIDSEGGLMVMYYLPDGQMECAHFYILDLMDLLEECNMIHGSTFYLGHPEWYTVDIPERTVMGKRKMTKKNYLTFLNDQLKSNSTKFLKKLITTAKHPNA
ncbi:hypothetical protein [Chitinophaga varians]|uniref:hypothetical protein n=1 Tax=Chitinophaga varians TaxID=2202339 RepID=UPI00165FB75F|nr:hypothetical protein [Chitinophaga varians]MBC9913160.1 hypothetical protein [Chitinophaga varians]